MIFIVLFKFRRKPTKADLDNANKFFAKAAKDWGIKTIGTWWTLGRWDGVRIYEARNEKVAMKFALSGPALATTETLVAMSRDEAVKLL